MLIAAGGAAAWAFQLRVPRIRLAFWQALLVVCLLLPAVEPWRTSVAGDIEITTSAARPVAPRHLAPYTPAVAAGIAVRAGLRMRRARPVARRGIRQIAPLAAGGADLHAALAALRCPARRPRAARGVSSGAFAFRAGHLWAVAAHRPASRPVQRFAQRYSGSHRLP